MLKETVGAIDWVRTHDRQSTTYNKPDTYHSATSPPVNIDLV